MDWRAKGGMDMLERIVALLLSLAGLADSAGARPDDIRCRALVFLRQAEAVAHAALFDLVRDFGAPAVPQATVAPPLDGDSPADAALLALRLRALALLITGLVTWLRKTMRRGRCARLWTLAVALVRAVDGADMRRAHPVARPFVDTS